MCLKLSFIVVSKWIFVVETVTIFLLQTPLIWVFLLNKMLFIEVLGVWHRMSLLLKHIVSQFLVHLLYEPVLKIHVGL